VGDVRAAGGSPSCLRTSPCHPRIRARRAGGGGGRGHAFLGIGRHSGAPLPACASLPAADSLEAACPPQPPPLPPTACSAVGPGGVGLGAGGASLGVVQGRNGVQEISPWQSQPQIFGFSPLSQSPLARLTLSMGQGREQRTGKPHCRFVLCHGGQLFPRLAPTSVPQHPQPLNRTVRLLHPHIPA